MKTLRFVLIGFPEREAAYFRRNVVDVLQPNSGLAIRMDSYASAAATFPALTSVTRDDTLVVLTQTLTPNVVKDYQTALVRADLVWMAAVRPLGADTSSSSTSLWLPLSTARAVSREDRHPPVSFYVTPHAAVICILPAVKNWLDYRERLD